MSITKSYNKHTNTYYAYETSYEWDENKQKKIQKKRCIGQFDPETGEVIPNGKVGRPNVTDIKSTTPRKSASRRKEPIPPELNTEDLQDRLETMEERLRELSAEAHRLGSELEAIAGKIHLDP